MFEKLLSLVPYNPGLLGQLRFYSRRMRQEAAVRRTGLVFLVLAFMIQFFAVLAPPVATSATSDPNSMIDGGFENSAHPREDVFNACDQNLNGYGDALRTFGIACSDIKQAQIVDVKSTEKQSGNQLFSLGYQDKGEVNPDTGRVTKQQALTVNGSGRQIYARRLHSFDSGRYSVYTHSLKLTNSQGQMVFILSTCGNLAFFGIPQPVPPPKDQCPNKIGFQDANDNCDVCKNVDGVQLDKSDCDVCKNKPGIQGSKDSCDVCDNLPGVQTDKSQCDKCPNVNGYQSSTDQCDQCKGLPGLQLNKSECDKCPNVTGYQSSTTQCDQCDNIPGVQTDTSQCDVCQNVDGVQLSPDECDVCPNVDGVQSTTDQCDVCPNTDGIQTDTSECVTPCEFDASLSAGDANCKPCDASISSEDTTACVTLHKTAANLTTGQSNADGTTANPGDTIVYTLFAANQGKAGVAAFSFQEDISDVLDYADVVDLHGGTQDKNNVVIWPNVSIAAGATVSKQITVKVKNPVPSTPVDPADSMHFDLIMTNIYGNAVNIKVPATPAKAVETAAASLPNTGPGSTMLMASAIVIIAGYFYGRSRLLARESELAIHENSGA